MPSSFQVQTSAWKGLRVIANTCRDAGVPITSIRVVNCEGSWQKQSSGSGKAAELSQYLGRALARSAGKPKPRSVQRSSAESSEPQLRSPRVQDGHNYQQNDLECTITKAEVQGQYYEETVEVEESRRLQEMSPWISRGWHCNCHNCLWPSQCSMSRSAARPYTCKPRACMSCPRPVAL
eukprot:s2712_g15.t1